MPLDRDEREVLETLLYEAAETLDEIVELCRKDASLEAYVPGNLWAARYGYLGGGALDHLENFLNESRTEDELGPRDCEECPVTVESNCEECQSNSGDQPDQYWEDFHAGAFGPVGAE